MNFFSFFTSSKNLAPSSKKKLAFIIPVFNDGGAERVLFELIKRLDKNKYEINIICFYKDLTTYLDREAIKKVQIHYLSENYQIPTSFLNKLNLIFRRIYALANTLKKTGNSIIIPFLEPSLIHLYFARFLGIKGKIIVSLHTHESTFYKSLFPNKYRLKFESFLLKIACKKATWIIVPSTGVKNDLHQHFHVDLSKIQIISNPVDIEKIQQLSLEPIEKTIPILPNIPIFCHVGRFVESKNHKLLIEACQLLEKKQDQFILYCAGSGIGKKTVQDMITKHHQTHHIKLVGNLNNPYSLMKNSKALILTSLYESFSLVLVEAMASGTVAISVDCPSGPAEVLDHGKYGMLLPMDAPQKLADAMYKIIHNQKLADNFKKKGWIRALEYSTKKIIKKWERLFV